MGSLQWASDGVVRTVTQQQIFPHEDYDTRTRENDIALMKLQDCVTSSATILPIALASRNSLYEGAEATASGWGTTSDSSASSSTNMHKIVIPVLSNRVCRSRSLNGIRIFNSMLCAGTDALTLCTGDSGGPLAFFENDGTATLIGVTSFGLSSCDEPAVYSRVTEHEDWIAGVMRDNS
ncbi:PREDICTED: chymotrypsin B-like [Priapulus caudatus]|uniref:Chymotrypsin B-like n=1 Tax=Priapulus caudatus TaxID=37621 RepID=A0ABM1F9J6_PRICU|nr:PREDICTED: chymotrypsin B-like [Priapulus caudatus]